MRSFVTKLLKLSLALLILSIGSVSQADEMKNLKLRVEGHVQTMLDGKRTPLLSVKDYYSLVHVVSKATVEGIQKESKGHYLATIKFESVRRIYQDFEQNPMKKSSVKKKEDIRVKLPFKITPKALLWLEKLDTPFVKEGKEQKYLLKVPASKAVLPSQDSK